MIYGSIQIFMEMVRAKYGPRALTGSGSLVVRVDIPTRLVKVTSPKWEVAKLRRDGSRPSSGYSAEFIDASVLIKAHIFSLEWIMTNMLTWSLWDKYYST